MPSSAGGALSADLFGAPTSAALPGDMFGATTPVAEGAPAPPSTTAVMDDDFGGFDATPAPPPPPPLGSADSFGDFGAGTVAPPPPAPMASNGDFGGFGAPSAPSAATDGDFGDFGGFDAAPVPAPPAGIMPPSAGGALSADMFGAPTPAADAVPPPSAMAADDGFGGFDVVPPQPSAPALSGADFGDFDAPSPPPAAAAEDSFGGFGAPSTSAVTADDGFGDFGGFDDAPPPVAPPPPSTSGGGGGDGGLSADMFGGDASPPPSTPSILSADMFGDVSAAPPAPPAPPTDLGLLSAGMFGGAPPAPPAPVTSAAAADDDFFGGFDNTPPTAGAAADDGFGDFGGFDDAPAAPAVPPPTAAVATSDFGDFGGFGGAAATPSLAPPAAGLGAFSAAAADEDDSFGQFEAITPAAVLPAPSVTPSFGGFGGFASPTTPAAPPPEGAVGLQAVLEALLAGERYQEALACKTHIASIGELAVQKAAYDRAKEDDDLEVALNLKKNVLPRLRAAVQPDHVVSGWSQPSPTALPLAQIGAKATEELGAVHAAPFIARCCGRDLKLLAASSLVEAAQLQAAAVSTLQILLALNVGEQEAKLRQLDELVAALLKQLQASATALQVKPADVDLAASPKLAELLEALVKLRKVGGRLVASRSYLGAVFSPSATAANAATAPASDCRAEMSRLVRASLVAAGKPADAADEAAEEAALQGDGLRYWAAAAPIGKRCALSLLPLRDDAFPELPPTVEWSGKKLHAPAANLWAHCVRDAPPS